ncbi:MAG: trimethylamine corrinoid protein [Thermacetogenium sp.]|nr:trimethylamine corrinoid protein [Thermacetogenium sp.]
MSREEILQEAVNAILNSDREKAVAVARRALSEGLDPIEVLSEGFSVGIRKVGDLFGRGEVFLPELMTAAEAMKEASAVLEQAMEDTSAQKKGRMLIATVEGDVHDIGKGIVISLLKTQGIEVFDLGRDVPVDTIIEKAVELDVDIIGTSALLTTTLPEQKKLEDELRRRGLRDRFKTMVGGAPATQRWADRIGADAYGEDAAEAVAKALALLQHKK